MSFPGFNNAWYAEIIERFSGDDELGRAILAAACIVAQSLDELTQAVEKAADLHAGALEELAEATRGKKDP